MTIDNRDMSGIGGIGWMILLMIRDTRMFRLVHNRCCIDGALGVWLYSLKPLQPIRERERISDKPVKI